MKDPVPVHREPIFSPRLDLIDKYPVYDDSVYGEFHYRVQIKARSYQVAWKNAQLKEVFPLIWTSGRQVEHMGGGTETRANRILAELQPDMYVEINPKDANTRGIQDGEMVAVISPRSLEYGDEPAYIVVKARVTHAVPPGVVFTPYHWGGFFQGQSYLDRFPVNSDMDTRPFAAGDSCNIINPPGWDPETQMQTTKSGICEVVKLSKLNEFKEKNRAKIETLKKALMG
jgi:formate dehydrogenase major subunit